MGCLFFTTWILMLFSLVQNNCLLLDKLPCSCLHHDDVMFILASHELIWYELCGNVLADAAYCDSQESIYRGVQRFMGGKGRQRVQTKLLNGNILQVWWKSFVVMHLIHFFFISGLLCLHCYRLLWGRRHVRISWRLNIFSNSLFTELTQSLLVQGWYYQKSQR